MQFNAPAEIEVVTQPSIGTTAGGSDNAAFLDRSFPTSSGETLNNNR